VPLRFGFVTSVVELLPASVRAFIVMADVL